MERQLITHYSNEDIGELIKVVSSQDHLSEDVRGMVVFALECINQNKIDKFISTLKVTSDL